MDTSTVKLDANGRLVIPARHREAAGIHAGDKVMVRVEDGELRIYTLATAVRKAQEMVRKYSQLPRGSAASELLIEERREEVRREDAKRG